MSEKTFWVLTERSDPCVSDVSDIFTPVAYFETRPTERELLRALRMFTADSRKEVIAKVLSTQVSYSPQVGWEFELTEERFYNDTESQDFEDGRTGSDQG